MDIKKARELVESREKLDPDYKKAVAMCIEDDKPKVEKSKVSKPKVEKPKVDKSKVEKPKAKAEVKTEVNDGRN